MEPVAASRPRVSRWGTYYLKPYARFKKEADAAISKLRLSAFKNKPLGVFVTVVCSSPTRPTNQYPNADVDNYAKAVLDALNKKAWDDDKRIVALYVDKYWNRQDLKRGIYVSIVPVESVYEEETKRSPRRKAAVSSVPQTRKRQLRR